MLKLKQLVAGITCAAILALCVPVQALAAGTPYANAKDKVPGWAEASLYKAEGDLQYGECISDIATKSQDGVDLIAVAALYYGHVISSVADFARLFVPYGASVFGPGKAPDSPFYAC